MSLVIGASLALAVGIFCAVVGLDRDRAFYPAMTIVIASYYALFAILGASTQVLAIETLCASAFLIAAVWGFKSSLWLVVAALALHGLFDFTHGELIANPGVPAWWPQFCLSFDVVAAVVLALLLKFGRIRSAA